MKKILKLVFILSLVFVTSCEENGIVVNCQECDKEEPEYAEIEIKIDILTYGAPVDINVYEGNIEDGILYDSFSSGGVRASVSVTPNKKYTFSATYNTPEGTYTTIDSAYPRIAYNKDQCNDPCYYVYDKVVNLRLKYTK